MYDYIRQCTTYYDMMFNNVQRCSTMYDKNDFPTIEFLSHPKVLHVKLFFKFAALLTKTYDSLRTTAINHDNTRKTTTFKFAPCRTLKFVCGRPALVQSYTRTFLDLLQCLGNVVAMWWQLSVANTSPAKFRLV